MILKFSYLLVIVFLLNQRQAHSALPFGDECSQSFDCEEGLECQDKKCECIDGSIWDPEKEVCETQENLLLLGEPDLDVDFFTVKIPTTKFTTRITRRYSQKPVIENFNLEQILLVFDVLDENTFNKTLTKFQNQTFSNLTHTLRRYKQLNGTLNLFQLMNKVIKGFICTNKIVADELSILSNLIRIVQLCLTKNLDVLTHLDALQTTLTINQFKTFVVGLNQRLADRTLNVQHRLAILRLLKNFEPSELLASISVIPNFIALFKIPKFHPEAYVRIVPQLYANRKIKLVDYQCLKRFLDPILVKVPNTILTALSRPNYPKTLSPKQVCDIIKNNQALIKNPNGMFGSLASVNISIFFNQNELKKTVQLLSNFNQVLKNQAPIVADFIYRLTIRRSYGYNQFNNLITKLIDLAKLFPNHGNLLLNGLMNMKFNTPCDNNQLLNIINNLAKALSSVKNKLQAVTVLNFLVFLNVRELLDLKDLQTVVTRLNECVSGNLTPDSAIFIVRLLKHSVKPCACSTSDDLINVGNVLFAFASLPRLGFIRFTSNFKVFAMLGHIETVKFLKALMIKVKQLPPSYKIEDFDFFIGTLNMFYSGLKFKLSPSDVMASLQCLIDLIGLKDRVIFPKIRNVSILFKSLRPKLFVESVQRLSILLTQNGDMEIVDLVRDIFKKEHGHSNEFLDINLTF